MIGAALFAASCSVGQADICTAPPDLASIKPIDPNTATSEVIYQERRATACVHLWAYRMASSDDDAGTVAKAVVQACEGAVNGHANAQGRVAMEPWMADDAAEGINVFETIREQKVTQMEREALFRVVQARAGKCRA